MSLDIQAMQILLHQLDAFKCQLEQDLKYAKESDGRSDQTELLTAYLEDFQNLPGLFYDFYLEARNEASSTSLPVQPLDPETGKYPQSIMRDVREYLGLEPQDTSRDDEIMSLSRELILDLVMQWDGLFNYGDKVTSWIEDIYGINLLDLPARENPFLKRVLAEDITVGSWRATFIIPGAPMQHSSRLNDFAEPLVEFFDCSQDAHQFPKGQFVTCYLANTLLGMDLQGQDLRTPGICLTLDADIPGLTIYAKEMQPIADWIGKKMSWYEEEKTNALEPLSNKIQDAEHERISSLHQDESQKYPRNLRNR